MFQKNEVDIAFELQCRLVRFLCIAAYQKQTMSARAIERLCTRLFADENFTKNHIRAIRNSVREEFGFKNVK